MVERGIDPRKILAITFTNKAANEMQERVAHLLPGTRVWVSTFHKFCARILRQRAEAVGLSPNFTIYDTSDSRQLIKQALHDLDIDSVHYPPATIASHISNAKNEMQTSEVFASQYQERIGNHLQAVVAKVYPKYQRSLLNANAVDFDDLLLHVVEILQENPDLREELDERFQYVMVDEYQDTNLAQYRIVAALSHNYPNLCATGDPDQSIYGWRGARIDNILRFESEFPAARVVRLEENFRSTKQILRAADSLIAHNKHRKEKSLITDNADGVPVELLLFSEGRHEALSIASQIREMVESGERNWSDIAIFYRVNALSRELELALLRHKVPYQVAAGVAFYDRAEVKDVLSYLRLIHNPKDEIAFRRVVNRPVRGVGKKSLSQLTEWARQNGWTELEAAARADKHPALAKRAAKALQIFASLIDDCAPAPGRTVEQILRMVIERSGLAAEWKGSTSEQDQQRLANIQELVTAAGHYDQSMGDEASLEGFLETTSLASDVDSIDDAAGQVTLMTLHAAKGLEFPVVFIVAVEQNLIPHERSLQRGDEREYEEERRLLFVGMTRAEERLFLTQTRKRDFRGRSFSTIPSDFLMEIPLTLRDMSVEEYPTPIEHDGHFEPHDDDDASHEVHQQDHDDEFTTAGSFAKSTSPPRLTTAAELLNSAFGESKSVPLPAGFAVGMSVRHPQYGIGTIVDVDGFSKNRKVTVIFRDGDRRQTFVVAKSPLQPVGLS